MVGVASGNSGNIGGSGNQIKQERKDDNVSIIIIIIIFFFGGGRLG